MPDNTDSSAESVCWFVRLSDKRPERLVTIVLAAGVAGAAGAVLFQHIVYGFLGFAIILTATADYWMSVRYSVGPKGASRRVGISVTSISWEDVKRTLVDGPDIKLSPLESASRLDPFRGVSLHTTSANREQVLRLIQFYTQSHA
jgi:hypothetical protein